ncbi:low molecular weight phosphotyrosine protein phosphatase [Chryseobacterium sp. SNU WT5]|uniref:low molecular weight protein-tyrosine-phosphatase n=1 Tax=Chryseobacterium sp. SNU WT5 TaxID=2594269 RepID=UPI00117E30DA|nr:low molecular weight protein-tyrosine-phosphatase [Chryseobacterium sp. SNU WT5]QDP86692.1 low molecular weight phosphotyrosine protein phosphatase [Chryseobacterium sp. SNU WT5]
MVCLGNICRSPLAEGILKSKLPDTYIVESAGTINMHEGKSPDYRSIQTGKNNNVDISKQKSRHFSAKDFEEFDRIYCMDRNNLKDVLSLANDLQQRKKVSLLLDDEEVPDPYWGEQKDFDHVFQMLDSACEKIAADLQTQISPN